MTDDKLVVPDSTALNNLITAIYAVFRPFHTSFLSVFAVCLFALGTKPPYTGVSRKLWIFFACSLRRVLPTLSKLGRPRYLYCSITSAKDIAPASFSNRCCTQSDKGSYHRFWLPRSFLQNSLYLYSQWFSGFHRLPPYIERGRLTLISRPHL